MPFFRFLALAFFPPSFTLVCLRWVLSVMLLPEASVMVIFFFPMAEIMPTRECVLIFRTSFGVRSSRSLSLAMAGEFTTLIASFWTSAPDIGLISIFCRLASARNSGSFMVALNALRSAAMRSAGTFGGATIGRPISTPAMIMARALRSASVLAKSVIKGTSLPIYFDTLGSFFEPHCRMKLSSRFSR